MSRPSSPTLSTQCVGRSIGSFRSKLDPIKKVARTLKGHIDGLLTYFAHRNTNAATEALNGRIAAIKSHARGFRNLVHYRIRILFFLGKLELHPTNYLN